ncbi:hypothetical protein EG329_010925 [Mollisiaceae sp. DMI_Dod_QoI]|nr:hypothetical protein EG329_010925 [Helotiales sp. DMI_Dod_QoI]
MKSKDTAVGEKICPGTPVTYLCDHTWIEHVRNCDNQTIPCSPTSTNRSGFACILCSLPGSDMSNTDAILKVKTLGPEFVHWFRGLIKDKDDALEKVDLSKVEMSKLRKEMAELKTQIEREKEVRDKKGKGREELTKQVEDFYADLGGAQEQVTKDDPIHGHGQYTLTTPENTSPASDQITVVQHFDNCGHKIEVLGATRGAASGAVAEAVIKKSGFCAKCIEFMRSTEAEKIKACHMDLDNYLDQFMNDGGNTYSSKRVNNGPFKKADDADATPPKAKVIADAYFADPIQAFMEDLKEKYEGILDWNYGVKVFDTVTELELALREGKESVVIEKRNELLQSKKACLKDLNESADTFTKNGLLTLIRIQTTYPHLTELAEKPTKREQVMEQAMQQVIENIKKVLADLKDDRNYIYGFFVGVATSTLMESLDKEAREGNKQPVTTVKRPLHTDLGPYRKTENDFHDAAEKKLLGRAASEPHTRLDIHRRVINMTLHNEDLANGTLLSPNQDLQINYTHPGPFNTNPSTEPRTQGVVVGETERATEPSQSTENSDDSESGVNLYSEDEFDEDAEFQRPDAELRALKFDQLELEIKVIKGEEELRGTGDLAKMGGRKVENIRLSQLKLMASLGLSASIVEGFQSLDIALDKIVKHYMSNVVPHTLLGVQIAMRENDEMEIQVLKDALPRTENEMKEFVVACLEQAKHEIVVKCEGQVLKFLELAANVKKDI